MSRILSAICLLVVCAIHAAPTFAATSYFTGFEDFTLGPLSPTITTAQNGWSGGAQGGLTNNDAGDEQIVNTVAHTGDQSWLYSRGYNSPGQGTAYAPNISPALSNVGDVFSGSLWFKVHTVGDGSSFALESGNPTGDDRAEILAYVANDSGNLNVYTFNLANGGDPNVDYTTVGVASGLDAAVWHEISFGLTRTATGNTVSVSVDGGTPVVVSGYLAEYRDFLSQPYSESSRLKLRPRHLDSTDFQGFYLDDISYAITPVPEPTTAALALTGLIGLACWARRRRQK